MAKTPSKQKSPAEEQQVPVTTPETDVPEASERPPLPPELSSPKDLQRLAATGQGDDLLNVQLLIDGSDADGVRCFNEALPAALVRAILDPEVADFFITIKGAERMKSPRVKSHWLHTSYIREVLVMGELDLEGHHE